MAAIIVILWIVIGLVAFAVIGTEIAPAFGIRHMEGSSALFGLFLAAPIGAVAGAATGIWLARAYPTKRDKIAGFSVLGIASAIAGGFAFEYATNDMLTKQVWLTFEVRFPPGAPAPEWSTISGNMRSKGKDGSRISSYDKGLRRDGDTNVLQGNVEVWRQTTDRVLTFRIGEGPTHLFRIKAAAIPVERNEMGPWSPTDLFEEAGKQRKPNPGEALEVRYRIY
jgi:hypothetical protein